jgi:hypothetical protein
MGALTPVRPALWPIYASALYRMNSGTYSNRSPRFTRLAFLTIPSPIIRRVLLPLYYATLQLNRFPLSAVQASPLGCRLTICRQTESSSCSYGLVVRLLLLPTPPRGDAVALGYGPESVCPEGTFTPLTIAPFGRTSHQRSWWIVHIRRDSH